MQERTQKNKLSRNFLDAAIKTKSWQPVLKNGWIIKFSIYRDEYVLLFFLSKNTGQMIMRQFTDEDYACDFINYIIELDPNLYHNL